MMRSHTFPLGRLGSLKVNSGERHILALDDSRIGLCFQQEVRWHRLDNLGRHPERTADATDGNDERRCWSKKNKPRFRSLFKAPLDSDAIARSRNIACIRGYKQHAGDKSHSRLSRRLSTALAKSKLSPSFRCINTAHLPPSTQRYHNDCTIVRSVYHESKPGSDWTTRGSRNTERVRTLQHPLRSL